MNRGFKSFSIKSYSKVVKLVNTNVANKFYHVTKTNELFYSVKDGVWTDPTIWTTLSGRPGKIPGVNDDVYIHHSVTTATVTINNLFIQETGVLNVNTTSAIFTVNGNINCTGFLSLSGTNVIFALSGDRNRIDKFDKGTTSTFKYEGWLPQPILDLNYHHLSVTVSTVYNNLVFTGYQYTVTKPLTNHLSISGNLTVGTNNFGYCSPTLELGSFDLTVAGTASALVGGIWKSGPGKILIIGNFVISRNFIPNNIQINVLNFTGNPTVELRGGIACAAANNPGQFYTGLGLWSFTTNSQLVDAQSGNTMAAGTFDCPMSIDPGLTVTWGAYVTCTFNNYINGVDATSIFINKANITLATQVAADGTMTVGVHDYTTYANTIRYFGAYNHTLLFPGYWNLTIGGAGVNTKTASVNLTVLGNLIVNSDNTNLARFDLSTFNLTVNGTTTFVLQASQLYSASYVQILLIGLVTSTAYQNHFNLPGNADVEFRGSYVQAGGNQTALASTTGTGIWKFTTNNQSIYSNNAGMSVIWDCYILIDSGITLSLLNNTIQDFNIYVTQKIDGVDGTSKFINKGGLYFHTLSSITNSFVVGQFDYTSFGNTVGYTGNYTATLPYNNYWNLLIQGTGVKTQMSTTNTYNGNVLVNTSGTLTSAGDTTCLNNTAISGSASSVSFGSIINMGIYNWTFNGAVTSNAGIINKSGSGNVIFGGLFTISSGTINFNGNPNVDVRNGLTFAGTPTFTCGTGIWKFSTNSQNLSFSNSNYIFNNVLVSGSITVTNILTTTQSTSLVGMQVNTSIDGDNASSLFVNKGNFYFGGSFTPMSTLGTFDFSTYNTNAVGYVYNGNGTINYSTFWNFFISGTGVKTLSANTLIQGTYIISGTTNGGLEMSTFDFTVNGITTSGGNCLFSKNGAGNILFIGQITSTQNGTTFAMLGNPTIECRNGFVFSGSLAFTGVPTWKFTTNNQNFTGTMTLGSANVLISGPITVTLNSTGLAINIDGTIDGDNSSSTLDNRGTVTYKNATQPMNTGVLQTNAAANTWVYGLNAQNIKGGPTTVAKQVYRTLTLNGTGVKTLQGYVSVINTYTLTGPATLATNGFTLTNP